jgi:hypothetical protein
MDRRRYICEEAQGQRSTLDEMLDANQEDTETREAVSNAKVGDLLRLPTGQGWTRIRVVDVDDPVCGDCGDTLTLHNGAECPCVGRAAPRCPKCGATSTGGLYCPNGHGRMPRRVRPRRPLLRRRRFT